MKVDFIEKMGSVGALLAAGACPVCFPMLAVVGSALGLGVLRPYEGKVFFVFQFLVLLALAGNVISFFTHRNVLALVVGIAGPVLIFFALYIHFSPAVLYAGLFGLIAASTLNALAKRRCRKCITTGGSNGA